MKNTNKIDSPQSKVDISYLEEIARQESVKLLQSAQSKKISISTAESCTGGMVAEFITSISGASESFKGGVVSYTNEIKHNILGVKLETLDKYDAVSEECVREMAEGCANLIQSDASVSISGFAGPTGGIEGKPVGTVCFGYFVKGGKTICESETSFFTGSRNEIRIQATIHAIQGLLKRL